MRAVVAGTVGGVLALTLVRVALAARQGPVATGPGTFQPLTVSEVRRETPDAVSVRFAVPPRLAPDFRFRPGQHVLLRARIDGSVVIRPYSICSGATDGELRIAVRQLPGGRMSTWVNGTLQVGDVVDVAPPAGTFATDLHRLAGRHVLGIAAGSGITPVISVVSSVLAVEAGSRCTLVYGNRTAASTLFAARLADLQRRHPDRLRVVHLRSREAARPPVLPGRIDRDVLRALADRGDLDGVEEAYVCGPATMVAEVRRGLVDDLGLLPERVRTEVFSAAGTRQERTAGAADGTVRIRHRGAEHTVPVAAGETVLDAGLGAGIDLPYGCRAGACATCSARVSPAARHEAAPSIVRTCQASPVDGSIVDFDAVAVGSPVPGQESRSAGASGR